MKNILLILLILCFTKTYSQLQIIQDLTANEYVSHLVGSGVSVSNVIYTGNPIAIGKFIMNDNSNLELSSGVLLTTGRAIDAIGPNNNGGASSGFIFHSGSSDPQLSLLTSYKIYNEAVLEFDFIPLADTIKLTYVFASEEYPEFSKSDTFDVIGLFITGDNPNGDDYLNHNIALVPETDLPVSISTINNGKMNLGPCINCTYYKNNQGEATIQYDGLTTAISVYANVTPGESYHFKIAIADVGGYYYDSGIFLKAGSFSSGTTKHIIKQVTNITKCSGDTYFWHNNSYTVGGSYYDTLQSYNGYDSICQLNLIVEPLPQMVSIIQNPSSGIVIATDLCGIYLTTSFIGTDYWIQKGSVIHTNKVAGTGSFLMLGNNFQLGNYEIWSEIDNDCIIQQGTASFYIDTTIGIRNVDSQIEIDLYPNPTNGIFSINIKDAKKPDISLIIYSALGQIVLSEKLNITTTFTKQFDLSNEAKGIYYIKLINDKGICYSNKIIIQ